jgi:hypothetical protein
MSFVARLTIFLIFKGLMDGLLFILFLRLDVAFNTFFFDESSRGTLGGDRFAAKGEEADNEKEERERGVSRFRSQIDSLDM